MTTEVVKSGDVIQIHYVGTITDTNEEFDNSYNREVPFEFEVGAGTVIGGFDAAVQGMTVGEKKTIALTPAQAYGERNPEAFINFEKANFPEDFNVNIGELVPLTGPNGPAVGIIQEINDETVVLDMNHRLAGKNLTFALELIGIGATEQENAENETSTTEEDDTQDEN